MLDFKRNGLYTMDHINRNLTHYALNIIDSVQY